MKIQRTHDSHSLSSLADLGKLLDQTPPAGQGRELASVLQYKPHGACGTVTGSSHFLRHVPTGKVIMIDCGMLQGEIDDGDGVAPYPVHPAKVDVILITHAHVDHIGNLLDFLIAGFNGPILCTRVTAQLAAASLEDCLDMRFQSRESDDDIAAEAKLRHQLKELPERFIAVDEHVGVGESYPIPGFPGVTLEIYPTSHVIGSVAFRIDAPAQEGLLAAEILFSGDVGPVEDAHLHGGLCASRSVPLALPKVVVLESTYGDRPSRGPEAMSGEVRQTRLTEAFCGALAAHLAPKFIVPTFSLGRTTDVLLDVIGSVRANWRAMGLCRDDRVEIWCSSTLARVYAPIVRDALLGRNPEGKVSWINPHALALRGAEPCLLDRVLSPASEPEVFSLGEDGPSIRLTWGDRPFPSSRLNIWLQSPGVAISGRVAATIMDCARDEDATLLLVGYTPAKSLARSVQRIANTPLAERGKMEVEPLRYERGRGKPALEIAADEVRMGFVDLAQYYSGHADAESLIRYVSDVGEVRDMDVILVHGTDSAREQLSERLMTERRNSRRPVRRVHRPSPDYPWFDVGARQWAFPDMGKLRTSVWIEDEDSSRPLSVATVARRAEECLRRFYGRASVRCVESTESQHVFEFRPVWGVDPVRHKVICLRAQGGVLLRVSSALGHCQGLDSFRHRCFPWSRMLGNVGYSVLDKPEGCLQLKALIEDPVRSKPVLILTRVGADNNCAKFISSCVIPDAAAFLPHQEIHQQLNDLGIPVRRGRALLYMPGEADPIDVDLANPMKSAAKVIPHLNRYCLKAYKATARDQALSS